MIRELVCYKILRSQFFFFFSLFVMYFATQKFYIFLKHILSQAFFFFGPNINPRTTFSTAFLS